MIQDRTQQQAFPLARKKFSLWYRRVAYITRTADISAVERVRCYTAWTTVSTRKQMMRFYSQNETKPIHNKAATYSLFPLFDTSADDHFQNEPQNRARDSAVNIAALGFEWNYVRIRVTVSLLQRYRTT
jgi:hypothetical protein